MEAGSVLVSVILGSAYRPFVDEVEGKAWEEADRMDDAESLDFDLGTITGRLWSGRLSPAGGGGGGRGGEGWRMPVEGGLRRVEEESTIPLVSASLSCLRSAQLVAERPCDGLLLSPDPPQDERVMAGRADARLG